MIRVKLNDAIQVNVNTDDPAVATREANAYFRQQFPDEFESWRRTQMGLGRSIASGTARAVNEFQGQLYTAAEGLGQSLNLPGLQKYGREGRIEQARQAEVAQPEVLRTPLLESQGPADVGRAAAEIVTGSLPQTTTGIGGAVAGARLGARAGLPGLVGGLIGGGLAGYLPTAGSDIQRQIEVAAERQGVTPAEITQIPSPGAAFAAAVPQAALESAGDVLTLGAARFLGRPAREVTGTLGQRVMRGAAVGTVTEPPVEVAQTAIERYQADLPVTGPEAGREYLEAGLGGAIAGGVLGGAARGAFGARPEVVPPAEPAAPAEPTPLPRGSVPPTGEGVQPSTPAPEAAAPAPRFEPITLPERPEPLASVAETEAFLAENPRFTPSVPLATPEAAQAFVNAARVADWQQTVTNTRQQAIDDFVGKPAAPASEAEAALPINREAQATNFFTNLGEAQTLGNLDMNSFTPTQIARSALAVRDVDPGKPSKTELKSITEQLDGLADVGYLRKLTPRTYGINTTPTARPAPTAAESQAEVAALNEQLTTGTPSPEMVRRPGIGEAAAPQQPLDEPSLWQGYSLNAGPDARSSVVAQARNVAAVRQRPFTRPELVDFANQISTAPTPEARDQIANDFITRPAPTPTAAAAPPSRGSVPPAGRSAPASQPASAAPVQPAEDVIAQGPILQSAQQGRQILERQYEDSISNPIFKYFASPIMTMAKVKPVFKAAGDAMKRLYTRSQEATTEFSQLVEPSARLPSESRAKIALAMQDARSRQQMPDRANFTPEEYSAMESLFKAGQRAYDYFIDSYAKKYYDPVNAKTPQERARLEAFQQQKGSRLLTEMSEAELRATSPRGFQEIQTYNRMRDKFYFPQIGIGSHFVAAYKKLPGGRKDIVRIYFYTPLNAAQRVRGFQDPEARALQYLRQEFADPNQFEIMTRGMQSESDARAQQVRLDGDFISQYLQELSKVSGRDGKQIIERMSREIDKAQMNRMFRPNKDVLRAVTPDNAAEYILDVMPKYFLSAAKIQARRYIQDDFARAIQPLTANDRAYWNELLDYSTVPSEAYGTARAMAFFMYLGAAPDTALINLSQLPFVTLPRLLRDGGASCNSYFGDAFKTVVFNRDFGKVLKGDLAFTNEVISRILNRDEAAALIQARNQGVFTPLYTNESRGQVSADTLRKLGVADQEAAKYAKGVNKVADLFGRFMQAAEETNRLVTFIAAYRMAKANPTAMQTSNRVDNTTYNTPYDYAANVVFDTQFITSKEDRALVQRFRPEAEVATQFMSFPLKMTEQYVRHAGMIIRGLKDSDPVVAKAGAVALSAMLAPLITFAGIWGLPFADSLRELSERLIKEIWGTPINFKVEIDKMLDGSRFASIINNGVPHAYGYMSLQKRLGIDPLPTEELLSGSTLALFGPVGGLIEKVPQSFQYYSNGDYWGLAATLLPRAFGNVVKGAQLAIEEEQLTRRGTSIIVPELVRGVDERNVVPASIRQALGFPPPEFLDARELVGRQMELESQTRKATQRVHMELARIQVEVLRAQQRGDTAAVAEGSNKFRTRLLEIAREQDGKPLDQQVRPNLSEIRDRAIKDFQGRASPEVLLRETPQQQRAALIEELRRRGQIP